MPQEAASGSLGAREDRGSSSLEKVPSGAALMVMGRGSWRGGVLHLGGESDLSEEWEELGGGGVGRAKGTGKEEKDESPLQVEGQRGEKRNRMEAERRRG